MRSRGLAISDQAGAEHHLRHIGYYRLSGYALPFQKGGSGPDRHEFVAGASFEAIFETYVFDRKLRLLVMDAVERIEIGIRAALCDEIAIKNGPHWYCDAKLFGAAFNHPGFLDDIKREIGHDQNNSHKRDVYISHYYSTYSAPSTPPCWMTFESISFGTISRIIKNLLPVEVKYISNRFGLRQAPLASWLHTISYTRNLCAHHSRLWSREFRIRPMVPNPPGPQFFVNNKNDRLYAVLCAIQYLLTVVAPTSGWHARLVDLLAEHPDISPRRMGFPDRWQTMPPWI